MLLLRGASRFSSSAAVTRTRLRTLTIVRAEASAEGALSRSLGLRRLASKAGDGEGGSSSGASEREQGGASSDSTAGASQDANAGAKDGANAGESSPPPLYARLVEDVTAIFEKVKAMAGSTGGSASGGGSGTGAAASGPTDDSTTAVVVRPPSFWEKHFNPESPFFERLRGFLGGAGNAAGGLGDTVFGETEQAEAMRELRELMPDFNQEEFLQMIRKELGPSVIGAYLKGDSDVLRATCREQAYATLQASIVDRQSRQMRMDPRILHMGEPELEGIRIIGGRPTPIVSFETHQVYCLRSGMSNKVVEGDEDDIRSFHYLWALQPNEQSDSDEKWQVTELAVRGVMEVY